MMSVANRSTIRANILKYGKNKLMEIGNAQRICGTPIWRFRCRRLLRKNSYLRRRELRMGITAGQTHVNQSIYELANASGDRATGRCFYRSSFHHLFRNPAPRAKQGAPSGGSQCSDAAMG